MAFSLCGGKKKSLKEYGTYSYYLKNADDYKNPDFVLVPNIASHNLTLKKS